MIHRKKYFLIVFKSLLILLLISIISLGCKRDTIKIALTKASGSPHYAKYEQWLKNIDSTIEYIDLYKMNIKDAEKVLKECSGLVLTGGPDVKPDKYGKASDSSRCEIDIHRDSLEFALIDEANELKLPILAICRGEQIFNVAFGGSLIVDIPSDFDTIVQHRCPDPENCFHEVMVVKNSQLYKITGVEFGRVNSNHHQAVDKLAKEFRAVAYSKDGLIEAYEWKDLGTHPFLIAVQWHPERLSQENNLSSKIGERFIEEVFKFNKMKEKK